MLYRNVKTGAEMLFSSVITAPDWVPVEKTEPKALKEAPKKEPPKEEPKEVAPKKSKSAPKKRTKK